MKHIVTVSLFNCFIFSLFLVKVPSVSAQSQDHPFLIVNESMYPDLRSKANIEPWATVKTNAIAKANSTLDPDHWDWWFKKSDVVGASSLSYILDYADKDQYRQIILQAIDDAYVREDQVGGCYFEKEVRPGVFLVNAIVGYDIIYSDLTTSERADIEMKLETLVNKLNCGWEWNLFSVHAIWDLFKGNTSDVPGEGNDYYDWKGYYDYAMENYTFTDDGVFSGGPGYGNARFAWRRDSKYALMDIAEFTGTGNYYSDPRFINFYEWFYGYAYTPMNSMYTFGDSAPNNRIMSWDQHAGHAAVRAYRFSDTAASFAELRWEGKNIDPNLFSYVLMDEAFPQVSSKAPTSRIFNDGGAYFIEQPYEFTSLTGVLNNNTKRVWHTHSDVNALHITAYGENILQNSGYQGPNQPYETFDWFYRSHDPHSNNTVVIDNVNHLIGTIVGDGGDYYAGGCQVPGYQDIMVYNAPCTNPPYTKRGAGISEGFVSSLFDYASGEAGPVVTNGTYDRNFIFVHPQDGLNGYFVTLDEIDADSSNSEVNVVFHPNSGTPSVDKFWFRFNGDLYDGIGKHTAIADPGYSFTPGRFSLDQAISIDGNDITVAGSEDISFTSSSFSISVWFQTNQNTIQTLISKPNIAKVYLEPNGTLSTSVYDADTSFGVNGAITISDTSSLVGPLNDNKWHNAILLVDTNGTTRMEVSLYADGTLIEKVNYSGAIIGNTTDPWIIGSENGSNIFTGAIDDVKLYSRKFADDQIANLSNPSSGVPETIQTNEEYQWNIDGAVRFNKDNDVNVAIVLGQTPTSVEFPWSSSVVMAGASWQTLGHHYTGNFETDSQGKANIPHVIYPFDTTHQKASMSRIETADYSGIEIDAGSGLTDYVIAVPFDTIGEITHDTISFNGRSTIYRKSANDVLFYFVRMGTRLYDSISKKGFESDQPVSVHLRDGTGTIISPGTNVTFYDTDISNVLIDNANATLLEQSSDHVRLFIPSGNHSIAFNATPQPTVTYSPSKPGDTDNDGDVDISDLSTLLATFGSTGSGLSADFDQDQDVDISDLSTLLANFGS